MINWKALFKSIILIILVSSCGNEYDCSNYSASNLNYDQEAIELNNKGVKFQINMNLDSAIYYFNLSIKKDPNYYIPHGNIGNVLIEKGDYNQAKLEFEKIIELRPNMPEGHGGIAMFYDYLDLDDKAKKEYDIAIKLYTDRIECSNDNENIMETSRINRAVLYMLYGQVDKGKSELENLKDQFEGKPELEKWMDEIINLEKESFLQELYE